PNTAFNAVPVSGGVDLYLRTAPNPPYTGFDECFANGVNPPTAALLAAVERPAALNQLFEPSGPPAWQTIPSWSLIGTEDNVIPPGRQQPEVARRGPSLPPLKAGPSAAPPPPRIRHEHHPRRGRCHDLTEPQAAAGHRRPQPRRCRIARTGEPPPSSP